MTQAPPRLRRLLIVGLATVALLAHAALVNAAPGGGKGRKIKPTGTATASPSPSPTPTASESPSPSPSPSPEPTSETSPSPSPEPTSPSPTPTSPSGPTTLVTPEGTTIEINTAGPWTTDQIYRMLLENGLNATVGPTLTVKVQDVYPSQVASGASSVGGRYTGFSATMYLKGVDSAFANVPDAQLAHEFGHVWTGYHLYMSQNGDWGSYLTKRGLAGDSRLDTAYHWDRGEIIAEDYRLLFGSAAAIQQRPWHMNTEIPDPRNVPGLRDFFTQVWAVPR